MYHRLMEETTSAQDLKLLDTAISGNRSGVSLSEAVNGLLTPEEAVLRLKQLLHEDNILDAVEERRLFFWKARQFLVKAERDWDDGVKNASRIALDALKFAADFAKGESELDKIQMRYDERQTQDMVTAINTLALLLSGSLNVPRERMIELAVEAVPQALEAAGVGTTE